MPNQSKKELLSAIGIDLVEDLADIEIDWTKTAKTKDINVIITKGGQAIVPVNEDNPLLSLPPELSKILRKQRVFIVWASDYSLIDQTIREASKNMIDDEVPINPPEEEESDEVSDTAPDPTAIESELNSILAEAIKKDASDIHILPKKSTTQVKFRENGKLVLYKQYPKHLSQYFVNKIKGNANLDITNKLTPQDGKFAAKIQGMTLECRVSTAMTTFGENSVIRVQKTGNMFDLRLDDLGFEPEDLERYRAAFLDPYGLLLNVGATGAGKTTTFYLTIAELLKKYPFKNISTAEDPVEISFEGAVQFEIDDAKGLTFARVLKALLRQDPDIILIGEIRDEETSSIAVKAAMTGHLVLATLHATDALNALPRMLDIGISPQQIASTVSCIVSQRLLRKLCNKCKVSEPIPGPVKKQYGFDFDETFVPVGCPKCNNTGYKGRTASAEVFVPDEKIKRLIGDGASEIAIRMAVRDSDFQSLWANGIKKLRKGDVSLPDLLEMLKPDVILDSLGEK